MRSSLRIVLLAANRISRDGNLWRGHRAPRAWARRSAPAAAPDRGTRHPWKRGARRAARVRGYRAGRRHSQRTGQSTPPPLRPRTDGAVATGGGDRLPLGKGPWWPPATCGRIREHRAPTSGVPRLRRLHGNRFVRRGSGPPARGCRGTANGGDVRRDAVVALSPPPRGRRRSPPQRRRGVPPRSRRAAVCAPGDRRGPGS